MAFPVSHEDLFGAALNYVADNGNKLFVCSSQPTTYTEASATYMLAQHNMTVGHGNGDYTVYDGFILFGMIRTLAIAAQPGVGVTNPGLAVCVAICDSAGAGKVLVVFELIQYQSLGAADTVSVPGLFWQISDSP